MNRKIYVTVTWSVNLVARHRAVGAWGRQGEGGRIDPLYVFETVRGDEVVRHAREWVANQVHALDVLIGPGGVGSSRDAERQRLSSMKGEQAAHLPTVQKPIGTMRRARQIVGKQRREVVPRGS
ncbi:MAG: hypothetical protein DMG72_18980 [Acidobacteria bacterium]|nr:MAG: hypothetical protein DMG72_18980 [Acidobacteriota bacterium]